MFKMYSIFIIILYFVVNIFKEPRKLCTSISALNPRLQIFFIGFWIIKGCPARALISSKTMSAHSCQKENKTTWKLAKIFILLYLHQSYNFSNGIFTLFQFLTLSSFSTIFFFFVILNTFLFLSLFHILTMFVKDTLL